jgi:hypothetical protein
MPGSGDIETGLVSNLDTQRFSVFLGVRRYKEGEKNQRGDTYTDYLKKVWGWPPTHFDGLLGVLINDRCSLLTVLYGVFYRSKFSGDWCQERSLTTINP